MRSRFFTLLAGALLFSSSLFAIAHGGMLGPNAQPIVDSNGNGRPDAGDSAIGLVYNSAMGNLQIVSPFDCKGQSNVVNFLGIDMNGKYAFVNRSADNGSIQTMGVGGFDANQFPTSFNFTESFPSALKGLRPSAALLRSGNGTLVDTNMDGAYDQLQLTGNSPLGPVNLNLDLAYFDSTGGSIPDYVSLPWGALQTAGFVKNTECNPNPPQVFIPLVDTNGDGHPDSIVLDLDGNGVADPVFYQSPPLLATVAPPVPTLSQWAALFLSFSLCAAALITLRRRGFSLSI